MLTRHHRQSPLTVDRGKGSDGSGDPAGDTKLVKQTAYDTTLTLQAQQT